MRPSMKCKLTCILVFSLAGAEAEAGGLALPTRGVRALSLGGAFVAGAEEANALWYNPSRLDGTSVALELGAVETGASFTPPDGTTVSNTATPLLNPTLGGVFRINEMFSVALGAYAPYSGQLAFAEDGPQRYSLTANDHTTLLVLNAAAAVRLGRLRLGAGIQNVMAHVKQRSVLSSYTGLFGTPDDPELDTLSNLDLNDPFTLSANAGASFEAGPFTFGLALQLPYTVSGDAKFQVRLGPSVFLDPIVVEGDSAKFELPFPLMVRGGVLWQANADLRVEASVNFENWSVQEELVVDPTGRITLRNVPGIGDYELGKLVIPRKMQDTWSFHLGSDYAVIEGLHARGGGFFETAGFADETTAVSQLDGTKLGFALGASYQLGDFRFDLAASRIFQFTRDITNSSVRQLNPTNPEQAQVVGNGRYEAGYWVGGIGIAWTPGV